MAVARVIRVAGAVFALTLLIIAIVAHLLQFEEVAEALGNVVFFVALALAIGATFYPRREPVEASGASLTVTIVTQDDLSRNSGYVSRVDHIARTMRALGHTVTVVGFCSGEPAVEARCSRSGLFGKFQALWRGFFMRADVVIVTSIGALYNGWYALALRATERRVIYDSHDPVVDMLAELFADRALTRFALPYVAFQERLIDRNATAALMGGPMELELVRSRGWRGPLLMFYNANDATIAFQPSADGNPFRSSWKNATVVVYAGGLQRKVRGLEAQIEAVALARKRGVDVRLFVAGFGERAYFESLARELVFADAAEFVADMPYVRLLRLLDSCDVAISCEPVRYGLQTKMFDYLAHGVRIVAIDDGRDVVTTFGDLTTRYSGSVEALAGTLGEIATRGRDAQERANRRERGLALIAGVVAQSHENAAKALALTAAAR